MSFDFLVGAIISLFSQLQTGVHFLKQKDINKASIPLLTGCFTQDEYAGQVFHSWQSELSQ